MISLGEQDVFCILNVPFVTAMQALDISRMILPKQFIFLCASLKSFNVNHSTALFIKAVFPGNANNYACALQISHLHLPAEKAKS